MPDDLLLPFAEHYKQLQPIFAELEKQKQYEEILNKIRPFAYELEQARQQILVDHFNQLPDLGLSQRETEIAYLAAHRKTTKEISEELFLSENTVRNHLGHIFEKLGISGTARNKREKLESMLPK